MGARHLLAILLVTIVASKKGTTMAFEPKEYYDNFVLRPEVETLEGLKKTELLELGKFLELEVKASMRKDELKQIVLEHLVDENLLSESVLKTNVSMSADEIVKLKQLQYDHDIRMKELELRMKQCDVEKLKLEKSRADEVDLTRYLKMVPKFDEKDPDQFFLHFEKLATQCKWDPKIWVLLIQSSLVGRAQEVYTSLGIEECKDYETVKGTILKTYEMVPEAYRQKFRNSRKVEGQTFIEFARQKEVLFDRWCRAKNVNSFEKLRQLVLVEDFKRCTFNDLKTYLDEKQVSSLPKAAQLADEYVLTHKGSSRRNQRSYEHSKKGTESNVELPEIEKVECTNEDGEKSRLLYKGRPFKHCDFCKKNGHVKDDCWHLNKKHEKVAFVSSIQSTFQPFISEGYVSPTNDVHSGGKKKIQMLRDTGASQTLMLENVLPLKDLKPTGETVLVHGLYGYDSVPLYQVHLESSLVSGPIVVGVTNTLPVEEVSILLGNDLAGDCVFPVPRMTENPIINTKLDVSDEACTSIYPDCVVTRAMKKKESDTQKHDDVGMGLSDTFMVKLDDNNTSHDFSDKMPVTKPILSRENLLLAQKEDPDLAPLLRSALSEKEAETVPICYYIQNDILMRKYRPPYVPADEEWKVLHQVVVPSLYRKEILSLAHEHSMSGHLGVSKTCDRILQNFYWPGLRKDVSRYCSSCHICQVVGKPNQKIPKAPLQPIPAFDEPFSRVIVDCVGPLPRTKAGNEYILTIMCSSTRFPEAIPLRNIKATTITKALIKFFTLFGLPKSVQSDQGTNFLSGIFKQVLQELDIDQHTSSAYHPESQGALERFHQTLKNMLRCYCLEHEKCWDEGVPLVLFGAREVVQESLGFSPFELVFGHSVRGPLKLCKEQMLSDESEGHNLLKYVSTFKERLHKACETARVNLKESQNNMKTWYDRKSRSRSFHSGDQVLVLWPTSGSSLQARYEGPYTVKKRISDVDYIIHTPDRKKKQQLCHINMIKSYVTRGAEQVKALNMPVQTANPSSSAEEMTMNDDNVGINIKMQNSDVLRNLDEKLGHLKPNQQKDISDALEEYIVLFPDIPGRTTAAQHDVDVGDSKPVKQHPYRANPIKVEKLDDEVKFMLKNEMIEPSQSQWSSPCLLVPKAGNCYRFCTDFRKVNDLTKVDAYPMPRVDDCIDKVGKAKFVSKFDLLKGYWQVPLTERAVEVSAFVVPDGFYQYKVMPFGMRNASATFQRMMNNVIWELEGCDVYIDDLVIVSDTWEEHVMRIRALFDRLKKANLSVNLAKCEFGKANLVFLGHVVGQGHISPVQAKVEAIANFPIPTKKQEVMRFLGMAGYYRKFCSNFSDVTFPLTDLLGKGKTFIWSDSCQQAFDDVKAILSNAPVLVTPDYQKQFILTVDASDVGIGAVLAQNDENEVPRPISYFSKKLNSYQKNYSTIEKECLAIVLALQHFDVYLNTTVKSILVLSDHNPLVFLPKMKNHNQRLLRWCLLLQEYNLEIRHIPGRQNVVADVLSRV